MHLVEERSASFEIVPALECTLIIYIPDLVHSSVLYSLPAGFLVNLEQRQGGASHRPTTVGHRISDRDRFRARQKPTAGIVDSSTYIPLSISKEHRVPFLITLSSGKLSNEHTRTVRE